MSIVASATTATRTSMAMEQDRSRRATGHLNTAGEKLHPVIVTGRPLG